MKVRLHCKELRYLPRRVGKLKKKEWLKLVYISNVITWKGFGNTNKKKNTKSERDNGDEQMKRERGKKEERRR